MPEFKIGFYLYFMYYIIQKAYGELEYNTCIEYTDISK